MRSKINELNALDQYYRDKHQNHSLNFLWRSFVWFKWKKVTTRIVENELIPLIKQYGFPGERLIGLDENWMLEKQQKDVIGSNYAFIILIHCFSVLKPEEINAILYEEIKKGNITAHQYASLIDSQAEWEEGIIIMGFISMSGTLLKIV